MRKPSLPGIVVVFTILLLCNVLSSWVYYRFDLTEDKRYTLSEAALSTVRDIKGQLVIDVLLGDNLPAEFEKLKSEISLLLEGFTSGKQELRVNFIDPMEGEQDPGEVVAHLQGLGLTPVNVTVEEKGSVSQKLLFPWALVNHNNNTVKVSLLKSKLGSTSEERINQSVQNLEYAFADAFSKLGIKEKKQVAVIKGNGELDDIFLADYLTTIREYYNLGAITLDSVAQNPQKVLDQLKGYDLALIAKPTEAFSEEEKYLLDQYMVQGGKAIWLIDQVAMDLDSLFNETGTAMALSRDLNLDDLLFRYGIRINHNLINDLYFTQVVLATGEGNQSQYNPVPWYYHPMVFSSNQHPINQNLEAIRLQFASSIDTLANDYRKTIIYASSPLSKADGVPRLISLDMIQNPPDREAYTDGSKPLAVLVEGSFTSAYAHRLRPVTFREHLDKGPPNKILVVSDGDVIRNQVRNGRPLELGYDKWTNNFYGNKEFLVNATNYLLDDTGLLEIRSKQVNIPLLDQDRTVSERSKWQFFNIAIPLLGLLLFGLLFNAWRRRKYGK